LTLLREWLFRFVFAQETFARRLEKFYAATSPLLSYYASQTSSNTSLVTLKGATSDEIWPQLEHVLRTSFPNVKERAEEKRRTSLSEAVLARDEAGRPQGAGELKR
jgi:nucleoside-triphosphate--adenylate kinase